MFAKTISKQLQYQASLAVTATNCGLEISRVKVNEVSHGQRLCQRYIYRTFSSIAQHVTLSQ